VQIQPSPHTRSPEHVRFAERLVGRDGDAGCFLPLGQDLEQQLGAAAVEFHVAELVDAEQVGAAVAGDRLGELPVVGGLGELVGELGGQGVTDRNPAMAAAVPSAMSRWDLPVPESPIRQNGLSGRRRITPLSTDKK
jgi:hypothetical protein